MLKSKAKEIRVNTINCIGSIGMGHIGGCLSIADLLAVLYFDEMNIKVEDSKWKDRDRLVLSKGHAGPALYATLAAKGYITTADLETLNKPHTNLPSHCDMQKTNGIDMTTGSLGQGMSAGVGMALAAKLDKNPARVFVIIGEGCSQEGQNWEAAMYAANKGLDNLIGFTDRNGLQIDGTVEEINSLGDLEAKYKAFGWNAIMVDDGNDVEQILAALEKGKKLSGKPLMIILNTIKGKGVVFMENNIAYHHAVLPAEDIKKALECVGGAV